MAYSMYNLVHDRCNKAIAAYESRIRRLDKNINHCSEYEKVLIMSTNRDAYKEFVRQLKEVIK